MNYIIILLFNNSCACVWGGDVLTGGGAGWFRTDADGLAGVVEQGLREPVVSQLDLDLLADSILVTSHLPTNN